jgi:hypothetical protein
MGYCFTRKKIMKTIELKHLAPYLPYGLDVETLDYKIDYVGKKYDKLIGFHQWDKTGLLWSCILEGGSKPDVTRIKPILRPLSDLTKEIEHNGEKFVPMNRFFDEFGYLPNTSHHEHLQVQVYYNILEWHFDVFGLIDKGLAVDINTVRR